MGTMPLKDRLLESEELMQRTGCYDGIIDLELRQQDPLKFEALHTKLRSRVRAYPESLA